MTEPGRLFRPPDRPPAPLEADPIAAWAADFRARARGEEPDPEPENEEQNR